MTTAIFCQVETKTVQGITIYDKEKKVSGNRSMRFPRLCHGTINCDQIFDAGTA